MKVTSLITRPPFLHRQQADILFVSQVKKLQGFLCLNIDDICPKD